MPSPDCPSPAVSHDELSRIAKQLARRGRGILAADESNGTIGKRLIAMGLENDSKTRRAYREVLLTADNGSALSGAIMFHETFMQSTEGGVPFPEVLHSKGVLPGIKVDLGLTPLSDASPETVTTGLDGLEERCKDYYAKGARFAKWRAALKIDQALGLPTAEAVSRNAEALAKYAKCAQNGGLVPIVEPEILIDGDYDVEMSSSVAQRVISACYEALAVENVHLPGTLLKPMMIMPGKSNPLREQVTPEQVARATLDTMLKVVPHEVPGIMFLSGGMSEIQATRNLNALNVLADQEKAPWTMSFSFGRALQSSVMTAWGGKKENAATGSAVAAALAKVNADAQLGQHNEAEHPSIVEDKMLYEGYRGWRSGEDPKGT